jgi:hypothetical protein
VRTTFGASGNFQNVLTGYNIVETFYPLSTGYHIPQTDCKHNLKLICSTVHGEEDGKKE